MNLSSSGYKVLLSSVIVIILIIASITIVIYRNEDDNQDDEILDLVYDEEYLDNRDTSNIITSYILSDELILPDTANLTLPIYQYRTYDLTDERDYLPHLLRLMPDVDLSAMEVVINIETDYQTSYLSISNESIEIHLLSNGALKYRVKDEPLILRDNIKSEENATEIAFQFLAHHGGVPEDIRKVDATPMYRIPDEGPIFFGEYLVKLNREINGYDMLGSSLCNQISLFIDASTRRILEFEWHWPELQVVCSVEAIPEAMELIGNFWPTKNYSRQEIITHASICYYVPPNIQESAYDTRSARFYIAPYLFIGLDGRATYILGLKQPN
ncbi:MAG: hypothetical protein GQ558_04320 [Thermoplasmata archaeon]|nr:hypothetical protein [Thermoplasmata archaeon]